MICTIPGKGTFKTNLTGLTRLASVDRIWPTSTGTIQYIRYFDDFGAIPIANVWMDTGTGSFTDDQGVCRSDEHEGHPAVRPDGDGPR